MNILSADICTVISVSFYISIQSYEDFCVHSKIFRFEIHEFHHCSRKDQKKDKIAIILSCSFYSSENIRAEETIELLLFYSVPFILIQQIFILKIKSSGLYKREYIFYKLIITTTRLPSPCCCMVIYPTAK